MNKILIFLLFIQVQAQDLRLRGYCFSDSVDLDTVTRDLMPILLDQDQLKKVEGKKCLEAKISDGRHSLFTAFLKKRYPLIQTYIGQNHYEAAPLPKADSQKTCRLRLTKLEKEQAQNMGAHTKSGLNKKNDQATQKTMTSLLLMEGVPGHIQVDGELIEAICYVRNQYYRIRFFLQSEKNSLGTTLDLRPGEEKDLGSLVQNLKGKDHQINSNKGEIGISSSSEKKEIQYLLSIF